MELRRIHCPPCEFGVGDRSGSCTVLDEKFLHGDKALCGGRQQDSGLCVGNPCEIPGVSDILHLGAFMRPSCDYHDW